MAHDLYHFTIEVMSNLDQELCSDVREPSLGGRGKIECTCEEARRRYHELMESHRSPAWRMPSFTELSKAERESIEARKECPVCSRMEDK